MNARPHRARGAGRGAKLCRGPEPGDRPRPARCVGFEVSSQRSGVREGSARGWTALSRHSRTRSTPRAGSPFQPRFVPCSSATAINRAAPAASIATPRSMLRRSMQAAKDLRRKSMGFSRACRTIRTSGTSCLSRSMATSRFSPSIRTDASCFLNRCRAHAGISSHVTFVGLGDKFQMWEPARFEERRQQARAKVQRPSHTFRRGAPPWRGGDGERRSAGMMTRARRHGRGRRRSRAAAPHSRAALRGAGSARPMTAARPSSTARSAPAAIRGAI